MNINLKLFFKLNIVLIDADKVLFFIKKVHLIIILLDNKTHYLAVNPTLIRIK